MNLKICIVEDTPELLDNLTQFLEMENFLVWPCRNGFEALTRMENESPDLIITDILMPGMDGLDLINKIRAIEHLKRIPISIFSAKPFQEYEDKVKNLERIAYIKKPASLEDILKVISDLLNNEK